MNNLLSLITLILLFFLPHQISAQSLALRGGLNLSNSSLELNGQSLDQSFKLNPGFHLGTYVELPLYKMITLETGLVINTKGYRIKEVDSFDPITGSTSDFKITKNLVYLDLPLVTKVSYKIGKAKVYGSFGPYVGIGLLGKINFKREFSNLPMEENNPGVIIITPTPSDNFSESIIWGRVRDDVGLFQPEENRVRRLDYGLIFGGGVEFKSIQFGVSYGLGLADISPNRNDNVVSNNQVLSLSLGYKILSKK